MLMIKKTKMERKANKMGYKECIVQFRSINLKEMRKRGFLCEITRLIADHHSRVEEKRGWKEVKKCPLCKSEKLKIEFVKFGIEIVCCENCSLRYSKRVAVNTEDIYSDENYLAFAIKTYMGNGLYRKERFGTERISLISQQVGKLDGKCLLDIGCGTGWFLEVARENGMEVYGQELGKELAEWTSKRICATIFSCQINEIPEDLKFDVITMFDLIEHVENPLQLILDCRSSLKERGIIVIFTPNFDSLAISLMKEHSNLIAPADHVTYFTKESVRVLAERTGFKLVYFSTCGIDLGDLKSFYEWQGKDNLANACVELYDHIQPLVDASGSGNHLRFILKKIR